MMLRMLGLMQPYQLTTGSILERGVRTFPACEVMTRTVLGIDRTTFADVARQARLVAGALDVLGISGDGRIATFAWNTANHLALYFGVPGTGRVLHTGNIRYSPEQTIYTFEHAADEAVFVDRSLLPVLVDVLPKLTTVKHIVVMEDGADVDLPDDSRVCMLDALLADSDEQDLAGRITDENTAAMICYTSGTTGRPKGVVYSHRSTWLHANASLTAGVVGLTDSDRVMPVVPMFHAAAWGMPYASVLGGAALVLPGPDHSPNALLDLMESQRVTVTGGVPTIWMSMVGKLAERDLSRLRMVMCGGSAVPRSLSDAWQAEAGVRISQAWGMTELSPLGTFNYPRREVAELSGSAKADVLATQGIAPPGVELRIVDPETRTEQPWDDEATGELEARGPWVARQYYQTAEPGPSFSDDGWLRTGDIAAISPLGYLRLVDRTKDLVKSGGEWISSVAVENHIMAHPDVAEAAVIAVPNDKWGERPLACVVVKPGETLTSNELITFLRPRLNRWEMPDEIAFIAAIPKTSVGKFSKKTLREQHASGALT